MQGRVKLLGPRKEKEPATETGVVAMIQRELVVAESRQWTEAERMSRDLVDVTMVNQYTEYGQSKS